MNDIIGYLKGLRNQIHRKINPVKMNPVNMISINSSLLKHIRSVSFKSPLSGFRKFLATEQPFKNNGKFYPRVH